MIAGPDAEEAPAKINLFLHVRGRRDDGYHELETLFAFTRFGDRLQAAPAGAWSLLVEGPQGGGLATDGNLVLRAARAFEQAAGPVQPLAFRLQKRIPVAAGLGGGSADAAAALRLLNRRHHQPLPPAALEAVAATIGADVPACLHMRPAFGRGTGATLRAVPPLGGRAVLLVNPRRALSTAEVFSRWDGIDRGAADPARWQDMRNDLEAAAIALAPPVADVLAWLKALPAVETVRMSGSGATCLALFSGAAPEAVVPHGWWSVATTLL